MRSRIDAEATTLPKDPSAQANYPLPLHRIIQAHGVEHVETVGLEALGYPVSLIDTPGECQTVIAAVEAGQTGGP